MTPEVTFKIREIFGQGSGMCSNKSVLPGKTGSTVDESEVVNI